MSDVAPEGTLWMCLLCGHMRKDRYQGDESCIRACVLVYPEKRCWIDDEGKMRMGYQGPKQEVKTW